MGVNAYRAAYNATTFKDELREHLAHGKPMAVTEFGTCAYRGAGERGGMAWQPPEGAVPDEGEQVRYFTELLDLFEEVGVDTALWFTFAAFTSRKGADLPSYGVVRMLDEERWEPRVGAPPDGVWGSVPHDGGQVRDGLSRRAGRAAPSAQRRFFGRDLRAAGLPVRAPRRRS
ncbi:hypothetical protein Srufu_033720 [Streptomyces libani subsp. rufus]|nr:hypothetical protein Srufu_033720 [Streptomyces libani subsp. rufus]